MSLVLLLLAACSPTSGSKAGSGTLEAPTARLSEGVSTVVVAEWDAAALADADEAWIEFGPDTSYGTEAPERSEGAAILLGTPASTDVHLRLVARIGDELEYSDDVVITTGTVPSGLPTLAADSDSGADFGRWLLTSFTNTGGGGGGGGGGAGGGGGTGSVAIFDRAGDIVWYTEPRDGIVLAAKPSRDGEAILYLWGDGPTDTSGAEICRVDLSGEDTTCLATPDATHDFVELADGSFTYGKSVDLTWGQYELVGNDLVNRTLDGVETTIWSAIDEIEPVPTGTWEGRGGAGIDWTHFNGVWYDEPADTYYVSFLLLQEVRKIPAATGVTEWVMGGDENDFDLDGTMFGPQHAPQLIDGGLLVFDNGSTGTASRLAGYALDEDGLTATETLSFPHPDGGHAVAMGDAHLLPNGFYAASFGDTGDMFVFSPGGEVEWAMYPAAGVLSAQMYVFDSLYAIEPN